MIIFEVFINALDFKVNTFSTRFPLVYYAKKEKEKKVFWPWPELFCIGSLESGARQKCTQSSEQKRHLWCHGFYEWSSAAAQLIFHLSFWCGSLMGI